MMKKVFLLLAVACMFFSCGLITGGNTDENRGGGKSDSPLTPPVMPESDKVTAKVVKTAQILQDGESSAVVMDNSLRWWKLTEPVRVETNNATTANGSLAEVKDNQIRITSYSLYAIKNVDVYGNETKLFTIPNLPALAEQVYELPNGEKNNKYTSYSVKSDDAHYKKIAGGKMPLTLKFYTYGNGSWANLGPLEAREYIAFWTNFAFTFSSPEFETLLNNYVTITGAEFKDDHNNEKNTAGFTYDTLAKGTEPRRILDTRLYQTKTLNVGLLGAESGEPDRTVGGQATNSIMAINTPALSTAYFLGLGVGIHEFGHTIDYDHQSSFTLGGAGSMQNFAGGLSACFIRLGKAPYCNVDFVGYYATKNESVRNIKSPDQDMLMKQYNEARIKRENPRWHKEIGRNEVTGIVESLMMPGKYPGETASSIGDRKSTLSDQYINDFEKAVYKNQSLYPDFYRALTSYFANAKAEGIVLD